MACAIRSGDVSEVAVIAISKVEELMRKLIATIAAAPVLAGIGLAIHTATPDAHSVAFTLIELLVVIA